MKANTTQIPVSFAKLAIAVGLTQPRDGMLFHLASGFLIQRLNAIPLIITAGHAIKDFAKWHREGIVAHCCVYHHSLKSENTLIEHSIDLNGLEHRMYHSLDKNIDCGIMLVNIELDQQLMEHRVPIFKYPEDLEYPASLEHSTGYGIAIMGFSGSSSVVIETPPLLLVTEGIFLESRKQTLGSLCSRTEPVRMWQHENDGHRMRLFLETQQHPSLKGMSGGPVVFYHKDHPETLRVVGQQIAEQPLPGGKGYAYAVANNSRAVISAISDCLTQLKT